MGVLIGQYGPGIVYSPVNYINSALSVTPCLDATC
jgi:hypothetical protein